MGREFDFEADREERFNEIDIHGLWGAAVRRRRLILVPTLAALLLSSVAVNIVTPRYTGEAQILLENQENFFTRPQNDQVATDGTSAVDAEAVASQVQLLTSRDIARRAIKALHLEGNPEFDPLAKGIGPLKRILVLLGVARDPTLTSPEDRILETFQERLTVFSPLKTRVLTVDFQSKDPELAAVAANKVAELYLEEQSNAKRGRAKTSAASLKALISDLESKLAYASAKVEEFRSSTGLLAGANNMTITGQQLAELNTEVSKARTAQADAQAKVSLIRDMVKKGRLADVSDVANNDLVRRISEQRVSARAQLALELRTLLPGHPRIKELQAQVADLDAALRNAVDQTTRALENEARIAGNRVANLEAVLNQQKKTTGVANADEIRLHELERVADAYKDQLAGSTAKYQAAVAREDSQATPADARIISRATAPHDPSYPKKIPLIVFATLATFIGTSGYVIASELLSGRAFASPASKSSRRSRKMARSSALQDDAQEPIKEPVEPKFDLASEPERVIAREPALFVEEKREEERLAADEPDEEHHVPPAIARLSEKVDLTAKGDHALCIVMTGLARGDMGFGAEVALARELSEKASAIILDLDGDRLNLRPLLDEDEDPQGLTDLLSGEANFSDVIHRDRYSPLHFIAAGHDEAYDFSEFDLILEAFSKTYDLVVMIAPPVDRNEIAFVASAYADFVIVAEDRAESAALDKARRAFLHEGAGEVIFWTPQEMALDEVA